MQQPISSIVISGQNYNIVERSHVIPNLRKYDAAREGELDVILRASINWAQLKTKRQLTNNVAIVDFYHVLERFNVLSHKISMTNQPSIAYYNAQNQLMQIVNPNIVIDSFGVDTDIISIDPAALNVQYFPDRVTRGAITYTAAFPTFQEMSIIRPAIIKFAESLWHDNTEADRSAAFEDATDLISTKINELKG